jgi:hypothetical protein
MSVKDIKSGKPSVSSGIFTIGDPDSSIDEFDTNEKIKIVDKIKSKVFARQITVTSTLDGGHSDWRSLWIMNFIALLTAIQFSFFLTSVWPYLKEVNI